jgi:hypothetical protein
MIYTNDKEKYMYDVSVDTSSRLMLQPSNATARRGRCGCRPEHQLIIPWFIPYK